MHELMEAWKDRQMVGSMDGWMDGWKGRCTELF